ncbi:MAG: transporter substrate-binding domain-containing protein [Pseudomonadota bacterium]
MNAIRYGSMAAALVLALAGARPAQAAGADKALPESINVGIFSVAPFVIGDATGPHGLLIEFFDKEVAPRMGVRFNWTMPTTVARLEQNLIQGSVSFTPILARTPAREASRIVFAGDAYVRFEPCVVVLPDYPVNAINTPADLAGMSIGWVKSGALPEFMRDPSIKLDLLASVDWEKANLDKLRFGRIQGAYFSDQFTPRFYALQTGIRLKVLMLPTPGAQLYGAFSPEAPALLVERYQSAARAAFANGRWEAFLNKALNVHGH